MGPHEVVNGANGSVTWCQGLPFCPQCVSGARACERPFPPIQQQQHCPGCRCGSQQGRVRLPGGNNATMPPWGYRFIA